MSTISNATNDVTKSREASTGFPPDRRTTSSTVPSSKNRYSFASSETGESSTVASKRNSLASSVPDDGIENVDGWKKEPDVDKSTPKNGRVGHRSHKSRNSGGFLLSNPTLDQSEGTSLTTEKLSHQHVSTHDHKGKAALQSPERKHTKRKSHTGLGVGRSPLATNIANVSAGQVATTENGLGGDSTTDRVGGTDPTVYGAKGTPSSLDVDSAQIVNLALNLSESRRNAARRNVSSPLPPATGGFAEGFAGGSLRQHLQQQRRASRNISPKPDRGDRSMTASPRLASNQKLNSPLQAAFDSHHDGTYQYHFSASTLSRAEKARNAIELMAQYRRLLQYVPPLKPQIHERISTASPVNTAPSSPTLSASPASRTVSSTAHPPRLLGRQYNPLQYIRNRKVRARERKAIDGESQGFGDLSKVSTWVDQVSQEAPSEDYQAADCLLMPTFSKAADFAASPHTSPQSTLGKSQAAAAKVKRPRIDWVTNPADMLADVFWLEQDDNKKIIEDRLGQRIFPQSTELRRPMSRRSEEPEPPRSPEPVTKEPEAGLRIDTRLPEFKSINSDKHLDGMASRARQKLHEVTHLRHGRNGSAREHHNFLRTLSRSDSDSSDSEMVPHSRRRRSGTVDSRDGERDILEKQMVAILAKEAKQNEWSTPLDTEGQHVIQSVEVAQKSSFEDGLEKTGTNSGHHSRSESKVVKKENHSKRDSIRNGSSGRASLEVPGGNPRRSLEVLDTTAPSSPQTRASKAINAFVPSIALDLSPPHSRQPSPTRNPLSRVKSKINKVYDSNRDRSRERERDGDEGKESRKQPLDSKDHLPGSPATPEDRRRSISPVKKITSRSTDESQKSTKDAGSLRRIKGGEESSGIRGLFKGGRGPVARVSDFLWKKESSPGPGTSSGFSTDESEVEDILETQVRYGKQRSSQDRSLSLQSDDIEEPLPQSPQRERLSYLNDMPSFSSPFERRGRPIRVTGQGVSTMAEPKTERQKAREARRKSSGIEQRGPPPRIDVQNASPTSSPDLHPTGRFRHDSDVSDTDSRRGSYPNGVRSADARLNAILGLPGKRGAVNHGLPVTGLSSLEARNEGRPSLDIKRQWSISDRGVSVHRGPMTKREIARVRALLLSSGIKAKEISRRARESTDLRTSDETAYSDVVSLTSEEITPVPKYQEHLIAARILSNDVQLSSRMWQASADTFCNTTINSLYDKIEALQVQIADQLTPMTRKTADDADEVSKDLMTNQTLAVKRLLDAIDKMMRRRRRKFRWLRRGGWVMVEWALVGVMWYVWFMVVLARIVMGCGTGLVSIIKWLFWL